MSAEIRDIKETTCQLYDSGDNLIGTIRALEDFVVVLELQNAEAK